MAPAPLPPPIDDLVAAHDAARIESRSFGDIDEQAACLSGYDQQYQQIGRGKFSGEFTTRRMTGGAAVFIEKVNQVLYQRGHTPIGSHSFGLVMHQDERCTFNGSPIDDNSLIALPPDAGFDSCLAASTRFCVIDVPTSLFEFELAFSVAIRPERGPVPRVAVLTPGRDELAGLRHLVEATLTAPTGKCSVHRDSALQDALLERCVRLLTSRFESQATPRLSAAQRYKIFCRARDYLEIHARDPIAIPELCRAAAASRRTLEYCFSQVLGESPASYLRALRLNGVRRELLAGGGDAEAIGDIASRWGLWHPSRFAACYKLMFGELPSQTTARL